VTSLDDPDIESLLRDADRALYRAKDAGRNTVRDADQEPTERVPATF
jgi:PleD family two-component response regulator